MCPSRGAGVSRAASRVTDRSRAMPWDGIAIGAGPRHGMGDLFHDDDMAQLLRLFLV